MFNNKKAQLPIIKKLGLPFLCLGDTNNLTHVGNQAADKLNKLKSNDQFRIKFYCAVSKNKQTGDIALLKSRCRP